jgi:hypothetical protein
MNTPTILFVVLLVLFIFWMIGYRYIQFKLRDELESIEAWKSHLDHELHFLDKEQPDKYEQYAAEFVQKYTKKVTEIYKVALPILISLLPFPGLYRKKFLSVYNKGRPDFEYEASPRLWFDLTSGNISDNKSLHFEEIDGLINIMKWKT